MLHFGLFFFVNIPPSFHASPLYLPCQEGTGKAEGFGGGDLCTTDFQLECKGYAILDL